MKLEGESQHHLSVREPAETLLRYHNPPQRKRSDLHSVVLELTLTERRSVGGNDNQLGFAGAQALDGRLVPQSDFFMRQQLKTHPGRASSKTKNSRRFRRRGMLEYRQDDRR